MNNVLVLSPHPGMEATVRAALDPTLYEVVQRLDVSQAQPLLTAGRVDVCLLDVESIPTVQGLWAIEEVRRLAPRSPVIVYTPTEGWDSDEEAFVRGVTMVLAKPVKPRLLNVVLQRVLVRAAQAAGPSSGLPVAEQARKSAVPKPHDLALPGLRLSETAADTLNSFRNFSGILTHSLTTEPMVRHFLFLVREILEVNRATLFLREPPGQGPAAATLPVQASLRSVCAVGLAPDLLEHFRLSLETGLGAFLFRHGRILRKGSPEALQQPEIQNEFELLGAEVAIPVLDRETVIGIATFDNKLTGEPLSDRHLAVLFHLLEELALGIKNVWLHQQVAASGEMLANVLRELNSACVVVSRDLSILHANKVARQFFGTRSRSAALRFSDLPQALGSKAYQVLQTGTGITPFRVEPANGSGPVYHVSIVPLQHQEAALPNSVLIVAEDRTQVEQLHRLELEAENLRFVKTMADRLTHEVGNALTPLQVFQQELQEMLKAKKYEPKFVQELNEVLAESVKRASRLNTQMRYLATDRTGASQTVSLPKLLEEAYDEAAKYCNVPKTAGLKCDDRVRSVSLEGDRVALRHAFAELLLNALQANATDPKVWVDVVDDSNNDSAKLVEIEIRDNGPGFTGDVAQVGPRPFYTTRSVGVGLGLCVAQKILQTQSGKLSIKPGQPGIVRVSLPLKSAPPKG